MNNYDNDLKNDDNVDLRNKGNCKIIYHSSCIEKKNRKIQTFDKILIDY